jgi:hypothetical protein
VGAGHRWNAGTLYIRTLYLGGSVKDLSRFNHGIQCQKLRDGAQFRTSIYFSIIDYLLLMKTYLSVLLLAICGVGAYVPSKLEVREMNRKFVLVHFVTYLFSSTEIHPKNSPKPRVELQKNVAGAFAAFTIATSAATLAPPAAQADTVTFLPSSSMVIAEKVIREGVYREYEIDVQPQQFDDARSTFKSAQETKNKKGKFVDHVLGCCIVALATIGA